MQTVNSNDLILEFSHTLKVVKKRKKKICKMSWL